jgi:histidine triad (HIT) family protein
MTHENCVFCKIARGEIFTEKIFENDNFFVIRDISPVSEGHSLVIPKKHYENFLDLPNSLGTEFFSIAKKTALDLIDKKLGEGFNLVMNNFEVAGQVVPHAHIHIIPRKKGDKIVVLKKI